MTVFKSENSKHLAGIKGKPKYQCPKCKKPLNIPAPKFMVICSSCAAVIKEEDIIINN